MAKMFFPGGSVGPKKSGGGGIKPGQAGITWNRPAAQAGITWNNPTPSAPGTSAGLGAGPVQTPANTSTPAPAATPPPAPAPVAPFLTAAQQHALDVWNLNYGNRMGAIASGISTADFKQTTGLAAAQLGHDKSTNMANQSTAGRGVFDSSIRANDLADLDLALATKQNLINTAHKTAIANFQRDTTTQGGLNKAEQDYYSGLALSNAQGVPPATPPPDYASTPAAQSAATNQASQHPDSTPGYGPQGATTSTGSLLPKGGQKPGTAQMSFPPVKTPGAPKTTPSNAIKPVTNPLTGTKMGI